MIIRPKTDNEYESMRCQRAFFFIEIPHDFSDVRGTEMQTNLQEMLNSEETPLQIIEEYAIADNFLALEVFMRCSQSIEINRLNRALESRVPDYTKDGAQKYTLLCFTHDENVISVDR
jgi:hypothetical protein